MSNSTNSPRILLHFIRATLAILLMLGISGCIPQVYEYYRPDYPGGENHISGKCNGPKDTVLIPYHGIFFDIRITGQDNFSIYFRIPEGMTAQLKSDMAELVIHSARHDSKQTIKLIPVSKLFLQSATQSMRGGSRKRSFLWLEKDWYETYPFKAEQEPMIEGDSVILILPDIYINGVAFPGLQVPFRKDRSLEFDALNC